ncbi:MAG: dihydroorotase [Spirochaetaceae bacterium]|nr:MAG: dihydroorotase [Spirochaetaceae bacterium]
MEYTIRRPDDFHVHLRQDALLGPVVRETARSFGRVLVMPNTVPPITTAAQLCDYRRAILAELGAPGRAVSATGSFEPLMTFKVVQDIDPRSVPDLAAAGAVGGKLYPHGVTTNSSDGARTIDPLLPVIEAMEAADLVLEIHAESPDAFCLDREASYLPVIESLVFRYPRLRVVIEHVSSAETVAFLSDMPARVGATVTVHHLLLTLDDVIGGELRPHHFCKPIAKRPEDRDALIDRVLAGDPRYFFGSDSAPHLRGDKESDCGCAGIYTAPVAIPLLVDLFERHGVPIRESDAGTGDGPSMERFVSRLGAEFYRLAPSTGSLTVERVAWTVPSVCEGVVPFHAGHDLAWAVRDPI